MKVSLRLLVGSAIVALFVVLGTFVYSILSLLDQRVELREQRAVLVEGFEDIVEGQSGVIKAILRAQEDRADADRRKTRELFRRHIQRIERDLRVLLVLLGGDPADIPPPPRPEPSGANNSSQREREPAPRPSPSRSPKPRPSPSPSPLICLPPPLGCVDDPIARMFRWP